MHSESCYLQVDESGWLIGIESTPEGSPVSMQSISTRASVMSLLFEKQLVESTQLTHGFFSDLIS
jgi:hypothetical protein